MNNYDVIVPVNGFVRLKNIVADTEYDAIQIALNTHMQTYDISYFETYEKICDCKTGFNGCCNEIDCILLTEV